MTFKISRLWLAIITLSLALGWLLPNNSPPWLSFHREAYVAVILLGLCFWLMWARGHRHALHGLPLVFLLLSFLPWVQLAVGIVVDLGIAWMHSLYLLGFAVAMQLGDKWEGDEPGQPADVVMSALALAALASAVIAIYKWLGLQSEANEWMLNSALPNRQYANLAQPNLLGSLLFIGTLGLAWSHWRGRLHGGVAIVLALVLMFAAALTGSRTVALNILVLLALAWFGSKWVPSRQWWWAMIGLGAFHWLVVLALPALTELLSSPQARSLNDVRLDAWRFFLHAAWLKPWLGYGAGQTLVAFYAVLDLYPVQDAVWAHTHNLVIEWLVWYGMPVGLALTAFIGYWFLILLFRRIENLGHMILLAVLVVLGVHSMLEFPLHYAYFLLPFGVLLGILHRSMKVSPWLMVDPWWFVALCFVVGTAFGITVRDYLRVQDSFYGLRFEVRGLPSSYSKTPPEVFVLSQFHKSIALARNVPKKGLSDQALQEMRDTVLSVNSGLTLHKLSANLALNGKAEEAMKWNRHYCLTAEPILCEGLGLRWQALGKEHPEIANIPWPSKKGEK